MTNCYSKKLISVTLLLLTFSLHHLVAQELSAEIDKKSRHSLNIEIFGRTIIWGSLNYEYSFLKNLSIGSGLGFSNCISGNIIRYDNGIQETGKYLDLGTSQMLYGNYFYGKSKHQILFTAGLTNFMMIYKRKYPSGNDNTIENQIKWNAGLGYQFSGNNTFFRLTLYCIRMPDSSGWFPEIIPFAGISIGLKIPMKSLN